MAGCPTLALVLRRLSVIVLICFSLLAIGGPAAACVLAAAKSDCCPGDGVPCGDDGTVSTLATDANACCLAAPAPRSLVSGELSRVRALEPQAAGPDPQVSLAWLLTLHAAQPTRIPVFDTSQRHTGDASLTYLYTLRLRL